MDTPTFYDGINETSIHCDVISRRVFSEKHLDDKEKGGDFPTLFQLSSLSVVNGGASKIYSAMKYYIPAFMHGRLLYYALKKRQNSHVGIILRGWREETLILSRIITPFSVEGIGALCSQMCATRNLKDTMYFSNVILYYFTKFAKSVENYPLRILDVKGFPLSVSCYNFIRDLGQSMSNVDSVFTIKCDFTLTQKTADIFKIRGIFSPNEYGLKLEIDNLIVDRSFYLLGDTDLLIGCSHLHGLILCSYDYFLPTERSGVLDLSNLVSFSFNERVIPREFDSMLICRKITDVMVNLRNLDLSDTVGFPLEKLLKLLKVPLRRLILSLAHVRLEGLNALVDATFLDSLEELDLSCNSFRHVERFSVLTLVLEKMDNLKILDLSDCAILEDNLVTLSSTVESMNNLELINLKTEDFVYDENTMLACAPHFLGNATLKLLQLSFPLLTNAEERELRSHFHACNPPNDSLVLFLSHDSGPAGRGRYMSRDVIHQI